MNERGDEARYPEMADAGEMADASEMESTPPIEEAGSARSNGADLTAMADSTSPMNDSGKDPHVPFLQSLVDAMRKIAEQTRDDAMSQLRAAVAERSAHLRTETETRAAELHELANTDLSGVSEWEKGEIQRIRDEAGVKVKARNATLEAQLTANSAAGEGAVTAVQARVDAFEAEMNSFFSQLNDIHDPAALASALKRIPQAPSLADAAAAPAGDTAPTPAVAASDATASMPEAAPEPMPEPMTDAEPAAKAMAEPTNEPMAEAAGEVSAPAPVADRGNGMPQVKASIPMEVAAAHDEDHDEHVIEATAEAPVAAPAEATAEVGEATTQVLVSGLTSFGAITSFKQSLERADGIHRVSLGLGTSGEFIFTAVHSAGFDVASAIRSFEESAQFVPGNGQLRVTVGVKA